MVVRQQNAVVGRGEGVSSFVHIHDAAIATVALLAAPPGVYNLVDDDPSPQMVWLPAFAKFVGAPAPPHRSEAEVRAMAGEDAVYYATKLSGASNAKAKANAWVETATIGVAGGISDRGKCRRLCRHID